MWPVPSARFRFYRRTRQPVRDSWNAALRRSPSMEPEIGAFVHRNEEAAREAAALSTRRWRDGKPLSRIDGMPVGIKDIVETIDMPTEMGSPLYKGWQSGRDAATVAALREAGAVIVGKTVTTEFAATYPGGTRNPWDLKRTPGGSSSGSAAGVAAGMISAGLGTQVVGSIMRPASFCGCVGFKPSLGAINRGGSHDALLAKLRRRVGGEPGRCVEFLLGDCEPRRRRSRFSRPRRTGSKSAMRRNPPRSCGVGDERLGACISFGQGRFRRHGRAPARGERRDHSSPQQ